MHARLVVPLSFMLLAACGGGGRDDEPEPNPLRRELRELVLLEAPNDSSEAGLLQAPRPALRDVLDRIEEVRTDPHVVALFVRLGPMGGAWGRIADLRERLAAVREAGKPIHCHFESIDNAGYLLAASSCDRITVTPAGTLDTVGVAAQLFYARSLLERVGITAEILQVGEFKGAAEPFTRDAMSPQMRESMGALLDDLQAALIAAIVQHRGIDAARAQEVLDQGPYDAEDAREAGLVDGVEFDDEARTRAREAGSATRNVRVRLLPEQEEMSLVDLIGALTNGPQTEQGPSGPRLVLAHLDGQITDEEERSVGSGQAGPFVRAMRELADDDDVRAVVLRISSPGGSALASDRMWHAVRRLAGRKPVIVSVGDMAASGGYYVAAAAHDIVASETSIVGSIGVVGGKVSIDRLLDELGVNVETIQRGAHADWSSLAEPWDESERAMVQRMMDRAYRRFVARICEGREMSQEQVLASAEGRIWSGEDALERGLIDRIGGLGAALALARERAQLGDDVRIEEWPPRRSPLEMLMNTFQGGESETTAARLLLDHELGEAAGALRWLDLLRGRERVLTVMPVGFSIR